MKNKNAILKLLIALIAGALLPLAFAPFGLYTLAFLCPAILLYTWLNATPRQALWRGLAFGIGCFAVGTSWIFISIHQYGSASIALATLITCCFILILAMYPALQGYCFSRFFGKKSETIQCLCVFPASWVIFEWLRATLFTGFPWLLLGNSQVNTLLHGLGPVIGVYGLSLAVTLMSGSLIVLARRVPWLMKCTAVVIILVIGLSGWILNRYHWTKPVGKPLTVSLVQGNIKQQIKWKANYLLHILKVYKELTLPHWSSRIIIWPEAAIPALPSQVAFYFTNMGQLAKAHGTYLITGVPLANKRTNQYYNGLIMIGAGKGRYLKRHLVPFGEYVPLPSIFAPLARAFNLPMSGFSPGPKNQPPLKVGNTSIAPFICYEIAYSQEVLRAVQNTQLIITITDDSWFGRSIALAQHYQIAKMRALETGRPLLLDANTGITALISPTGTLIKGVPIYKRTVLTVMVQPRTGKTPLMRWGYYPVWGIVLLLLLLALFIRL